MVFDFEKIDVYRLSLEVLDLSVEVAESVPSYQTFYEALTRVSKMLTKLIASMNSRASGRDRDGA